MEEIERERDGHVRERSKSNHEMATPAYHDNPIVIDGSILVFPLGWFGWTFVLDDRRRGGHGQSWWLLPRKTSMHRPVKSRENLH